MVRVEAVRAGLGAGQGAGRLDEVAHAVVVGVRVGGVGLAGDAAVAVGAPGDADVAVPVGVLDAVGDAVAVRVAACRVGAAVSGVAVAVGAGVVGVAGAALDAQFEEVAEAVAVGVARGGVRGRLGGVAASAGFLGVAQAV